MNRHTTWVVYTKELTDILRDRRTIISMVLVPLLFYPIISVGLGTVISSQLERTRAAKQKILALPTPIDTIAQSSLARESQLELVPTDSDRKSVV